MEGNKKRPIRQEQLASVVIRFAGDSGDGIQLTGSQFTDESALVGNDVVTLPNFPAEIRAPAGTIAGVSGFQIHFSSSDIYSPGDRPDVLVALNPAALKLNLKDLKLGGILILNEDAFTPKALSRVGFANNPCQDEKLLSSYRTFVVPITQLTKEALVESGLSAREVERCKNFFVLGLTLWLFGRPTDMTSKWIETKFKNKSELASANAKVLQAGYSYAEATEIFDVSYCVPPAPLEPGRYRNLSGSALTAYGLVSAAQKSGLPLFFASYPITPASELLHELARFKKYGVITFQAEDEIAAMCSIIGASYGGALALTCCSGPGFSLKAEALGLAVMAELPLVVVNVQRAGPSTGLPTKTEQSDLLQAIYGRHGEAPLCVLAASSPSNSFKMAYEACRIATKYMTPVILLSDGYIAMGSEPWKIADPDELSLFEVAFTEVNNNPGGRFLAYKRDEATLARPWVKAGTKDLAHRIGGLEKENETGDVSYDANNHHLMCQLRAEKINRIAQEIPPLSVEGPSDAELLLLGWGGTEGILREALKVCQANKLPVARLHLHYLNPLPSDLKEVLGRFKHILIPELNFGQLRTLIRDKYLVDARGLNRLTGEIFKVEEVVRAVQEML